MAARSGPSGVDGATLDSGMATAEFAVLLPLAAAALVFGLALFGVQLKHLNLVRQVGFLARSVEAGVADARLKELAVASGFDLEIQKADGFECLTGRWQLNLIGVQIPQSSRACGLAPGT